MSFRHTYVIRFIRETYKIFRLHCSKFLLTISIIINIIFIPDFGNRRTFTELRSKSLRCWSERSGRRFSESYFYITAITGIVFHHQHIIFNRTFHQYGIDRAISGIIIKFRIGYGIKIFCRNIIQTMVIILILYTFLKFKRYTRCPYYYKLIFFIILKQFRCPNINSRTVMFHNGNKLFFRPMNQIL